MLIDDIYRYHIVPHLTLLDLYQSRNKYFDKVFNERLEQVDEIWELLLNYPNLVSSRDRFNIRIMLESLDNHLNHPNLVQVLSELVTTNNYPNVMDIILNFSPTRQIWFFRAISQTEFTTIHDGLVQEIKIAAIRQKEPEYRLGFIEILQDVGLEITDNEIDTSLEL